MQRGISLVAAAALVVGLAGCGSGGAGGDAGSKTTLTFWNGYTSSDRQFVEELVSRFNESQDEYEVSMTISPWDTMYQKLMPAYQAGQGPTIVAMDAARAPGYIERGVLAPVDDAYGEDGLDPETLPAASLESTTWDGEQYGVPFGATGSMLYYNKTLFAEAGIEEPPATIEEMGEIAARVTSIDPNDETKSTYGLALPTHESLSPWPVLFWAAGGGVYSEDNSESLLDSPETIAAMEYWANLVKEEQISPAGISGGDADGLLLSGRVAMEIAGPWLSAGLAEAGIDYGVVPVPEGPADQFSNAVSVNMHLDASASEQEIEGAYEFFKFWNSIESQTYWAVTTSYPPNRTDVPAEDIAENPTAAAFQQAVNPKFYQPALPEFAEIESNIIEPAYQRILGGQGEVADILTDAAAQMNEILTARD
jgi:multiple sugar transport system substrate-binding protein